MASSSRDSEGLDEFSRLTDSLAYHVLQFLDVEDLFVFMVASKRARHLCLTVPSINVDNTKHAEDSTMLSRYYSMVNKFLDARQETNNMIRDLRFNWSYPSQRKRKRFQNDDAIQLGSSLYLKAVTKCALENLDLIFTAKDQEQPPRYLPPLDHNLKLLAINANGAVLHFPGSLEPDASRLETLVMAGVQFAAESNFDLVIGQCRSLKGLFLHNCKGLEVMRLKSLSLVSLKIHFDVPVSVTTTLYVECPLLQKLVVKWYCIPGISPVILLSVPKLELLEWSGFPLDILTFFKTTPLRFAELLFVKPTRAFPKNSLQVSSSFLLAAMRRIKTAKSIKLHIDTVELAHLKGVLPYSFEAERLAIDNSLLTDSEVVAVASLLQKMRNLKILIITPLVSRKAVEEAVENFGSLLKGYDVSFWESQKLVLGQLKTAVIKVFGEGNSLEFVKYLLKYAYSLECLSVLCREDLKSGIAEEIRAYKSPSTAVLFTSN